MPTDTDHDVEVLRVKSDSNAHNLAAAVVKAVQSKGCVQLSAIGASAVNQAIKAIAIANGTVAVGGRRLVLTPGMENTTDNPRPGTSGSNELTRIILRVWTQA